MSGVDTQCLVPGTASDYFDCCLHPDQCQTFYYVNIALLVTLVGGFVVSLFVVKWLRYQCLLWLAVFFQALVIVWRILYSSTGG